MLIISKITISLPIFMSIIEALPLLKSHTNPSTVKHFESKLDPTVGYWSPSTSSIDWCERNYAVTHYIAEFWNCISSLLMCLFAGILIVRGRINRIENRYLFLSLSFGIVGLGSAYFHGTLTHFGQMADELPMVYSMIIWWFILFRMKEKKTLSFDILVIVGVFYGLLWTYIHSLQAFVIVFQAHFTLMTIGGIIKLVYLYRQTEYYTKSILYLIMAYISLLFPAIVCWIIDQHLCERMNSVNGFNPQLHAWWHVFCAFDCHVGIVCTEAMRFLSISHEQYQIKTVQTSKEKSRPEKRLRIKFYFGLPFVDYHENKAK